MSRWVSCHFPTQLTRLWASAKLSSAGKCAQFLRSDCEMKRGNCTRIHVPEMCCACIFTQAYDAWLETLDERKMRTVLPEIGSAVAARPHNGESRASRPGEAYFVTEKLLKTHAHTHTHTVSLSLSHSLTLSHTHTRTHRSCLQATSGRCIGQ